MERDNEDVVDYYMHTDGGFVVELLLKQWEVAWWRGGDSPELKRRV